MKCPSEKIPKNLTIDLDGVDIGESFKISSIKLDTEVTPTIQGRDFVIATLAAPTVMKEPEKPAEAEAAEGEEESWKELQQRERKTCKLMEQKAIKKKVMKKNLLKKNQLKKKNNQSKLKNNFTYLCFYFVGLGNPTPDSENNRHNIGFKIIDSINKKFSLSKQKPKFKGLVNNWKYR